MNRMTILPIFMLMHAINLTGGEAIAQVATQGRMYFSAQPFANDHDGNKNEFSSGDFIYGRIESDKGPFRDAFGMNSITTGIPYLQATYRITREDGREKYMDLPHYMRMLNGAENGTTLNFDILPSAEKAKTVISLLEDFSKGESAGFFLPFMNNNDYFWKNGAYKVEITIYLKSYNAWGSVEETEKWPGISGAFTFHFNEKDVAAQLKNNRDALASVKENSLRLDQLPDWFSKPASITDPGLAPARLMALLKRDLPSVNIIKAVIPPFEGVLKDIAKNDLGVILYRYVRPYVSVVYKENGKCYLGSVSLKEDYVGGGKYGPLKYNKFWGREGLLDCSLVK